MEENEPRKFGQNPLSVGSEAPVLNRVCSLDDSGKYRQDWEGTP